MVRHPAWFVVIGIVVACAGIGALIYTRSNAPIGEGISVMGESVSPLTTNSGMPTGASGATATGSGIQTDETQTPVPTKEEPIMKSKQYATQPAMTVDAKKTYTATMTTSMGTMVFTLFARETPVAVNNFVFLAREGFYDATVFHRIIKGFMIQGGDPTGTGRGGPGYRFNDEPVTRSYTRGTLAMANAGPNTNGSQFFVMHADNALPKQYVIFGSIDPNDEASLKTLDALASVPVTGSGSGEHSSPVTPPTITSVTIAER